MFTQIKQFFAAPVFEEEKKQQAASLLNILLNVILGSVVLLVLALTLVSAQDFWGDSSNALIVAGMFLAMLAMRFLLRRGNLEFAGTLLSFALWAGTTASIYFYSGVRNATTSGYLLCIIIAGLLLGGRVALVFTGLSVAAVVGMWYAEISGVLVYAWSRLPQAFDVIAFSAILSMGGLLLRYAADNLIRSLELARRNEHAQVEANRELNKLRASLEQQVADRTRDLERRTNYLEASAQISHVASSMLDVDKLTQQVVDLIRVRFGMYYVGLFLVDGTGKSAMLRAGTGEAGQRMEARGYMLPVNADSVVGWSIVNEKSRVVQETGPAAARLATEELPYTRSETALPLRSRGRVIGALDVQSDRLDVFDATALAALQNMADEVAVALDNARLFAASQAALEAERRAYGQMGREAWSQLLRAGLTPGYTLVGEQVVALAQGATPSIEDDWSPEMEAALRTAQSVAGVGAKRSAADQPKPALALPIRVRGQTIGVVDLRKDDPRDIWAPDEVRLFETLTEQLGVALESARLYQDSQRRAAREQLVNEITARMRESLEVEAVLKSAAEEMQRVFNLAEAEIRMGTGPTSDQPSPAGQHKSGQA